MDAIWRRTSVTIDEAVATILGWCEGPIEFRPADEHANEEDEEPIFDLRDEMQDRLENLRCEYTEAKRNQLPEAVIAERQAVLQKHKEDIKRAKLIWSAIEDELSKGERSALRKDPNLYGHITWISLCEWMEKSSWVKKASNGRTAVDKVKAEPSQTIAEEPWNVVDPNDPQPVQVWYTAARHFARELVCADTTLLTKRKLLAEKVAQSMEAVGIRKRGGKRQFDSGTILKAFANVKF